MSQQCHKSVKTAQNHTALQQCSVVTNTNTDNTGNTGNTDNTDNTGNTDNRGNADNTDNTDNIDNTDKSDCLDISQQTIENNTELHRTTQYKPQNNAQPHKRAIKKKKEQHKRV